MPLRLLLLSMIARASCIVAHAQNCAAGTIMHKFRRCARADAHSCTFHGTRRQTIQRIARPQATVEMFSASDNTATQLPSRATSRQTARRGRCAMYVLPAKCAGGSMQWQLTFNPPVTRSPPTLEHVTEDERRARRQYLGYIRSSHAPARLA